MMKGWIIPYQVVTLLHKKHSLYVHILSVAMHSCQIFSLRKGPILSRGGIPVTNIFILSFFFNNVDAIFIVPVVISSYSCRCHLYQYEWSHGGRPVTNIFILSFFFSNVDAIFIVPVVTSSYCCRCHLYQYEWS